MSTWRSAALVTAVAFAFGVLAVGFGGTPAAAKDDGKDIPCSDTPFTFDAPGFTAKCSDHSQASINLDVPAAIKIVTMHAFSNTEATFLDVVDDHILGTSRVYYDRRSLESDISRYYKADFKDWAIDASVGGYEVEKVQVSFDREDPMDCLAFRKLGGRRYSGIGGLTVGLTCSQLGRDHAYAALKHLAGGE